MPGFHILLPLAAALQKVKLRGMMHMQYLLRAPVCLGLTGGGNESDKNCMCFIVPPCHKNLYHMVSTAQRRTTAFKVEENPLSLWKEL